MSGLAEDFGRLLTSLLEEGVELILVGGVAGIVHGAARVTYDVDVVYRRSPENVERLVRVLAPLSPYLRGAPPGLPFRFDQETVWRGLNFTLSTSAGDLDLFGEITGGGTYDDLVGETETFDFLGCPCRVVTLPKLIALKRAAGRPKDHDAIAELEALAEG